MMRIGALCDAGVRWMTPGFVSKFSYDSIQAKMKSQWDIGFAVRQRAYGSGKAAKSLSW